MPLRCCWSLATCRWRVWISHHSPKCRAPAAKARFGDTCGDTAFQLGGWGYRCGQRRGSAFFHHTILGCQVEFRGHRRGNAHEHSLLADAGIHVHQHNAIFFVVLLRCARVEAYSVTHGFILTMQTRLWEKYSVWWYYACSVRLPRKLWTRCEPQLPSGVFVFARCGLHAFKHGYATHRCQNSTQFSYRQH